MSTPNVFENKLNDKLKLSHERIKNKTGLNLLEPAKQLPNTNPYEKGTIDYDQWQAGLKQFNSARGVLFGTTVSGQKSDAKYFDKDASTWGGLSSGKFVSGKLNSFDKDTQKRILGDRKKIVNYAIENGLYTGEDWDNHEIKDKTIQWLWNEEDGDISGIKEQLLQYTKMMKDYGFSEPELKSLAKNKKQELINTGQAKEVKPAVPVAPLTKKPLAPLPTGDPIEEYKTSTTKPKKQGEPLPIPTPLTLDNEETPVKAQGFPKMDYGRDYDIGLDKDPLKGKYDLNKAVQDYEKEDLPKKIKRQNEYAKNTYSLDSLVNANISVNYNKESNTFDYKLTDPNKSYDDVLNELYGMGTNSIDKSIAEYARKRNITGFDLDVLMAKGRREADLPVDDILKKADIKRGIDARIISQGATSVELPQQVKDIALALSDKIEQVRILKSERALTGTNKLEIPEWVDPEELALSVSRGVSPTIVNQGVNALAKDNFNFDIATGLKNIGKGLVMNQADLAYDLLSNPRKILSKEYTDSEAMHALIGIYQNKFQFSEAEAQEAIKLGLNDIDKEQDTWSHATRNLVNSMGELTGELIGPFKLGAIGFDRVLEKGAWIKKFVEGSKIGNLVNKVPFQARMRNVQRAIEGKNTIGGGVLPYLDEVYGFAPTNVARVTAASFGSQFFWHGADVDEAIESAESMFGLEVANQSFNLMGVRAYKFYNSITKALRKSKGAKGIDELLLNYQKKLNAIQVLSSFPAQGVVTYSQNPEFDKNFASEMIMNLMLSGNNIMLHRGFNKQLKEYRNQRDALEREASNYASESPNREIIKVTSEDLKKKAKEYSSPDLDVKVSPPQRIYNDDTGKIETEHTVVVDKVTGFHDFAREVAGKTDKGKEIVVNDFKEIVKENIPEDLQFITEKMFEKIGNTPIKSYEDRESTRPAKFFNNEIYFNNALDIASNKKELTRAVVHEGLHVLTVDRFDNDPVFQDAVTKIHNELVDQESFNNLLDEYRDSEDNVEAKAYHDLSHALLDPREMLVLMYDTDMKEGRDAISKLKFKSEGEDKPKSFIDRMWDIIRNLFGKDDPQTNDYIKRFRDIVEGYDFDATLTPKKENKSNTEPIQREIDNPVLFMPELVNTNKLNQYNEARKENGLPELSSNEMIAEYRARYGTSPNGIKMDLYMDLKKREMLNKSKGEDTMSQIVNDISKANDYQKEGFIDKSEIKYAKEVFGVSNMSEVYEKAQGKSVNELTDMIKDKVTMKYSKAPHEVVEKIANYKANRIKQIKIRNNVEIIISPNGNVSTSLIRTDHYNGINPIDKSIGEFHYLGGFLNKFPKSFRNANGELRSYVPERVDKFFSLLDANNIFKIGGIDFKGNKTTKINENIIKGKLPIELIGQGYFLMPKGPKNESLFKIPGLASLSRKPERAIDFAKEAQRFNFYRWLDSDSQWIGSKEGVFKGRILANLGGKLDFDMMLDKYIKNQNIAFKDLFKEAQIGEINTSDIDLIGKKLKQYYMDASGQYHMPEYRDVMSNTKAGNYEIKKLLNETIKDLLHWRLDAGGGNRVIELINNKLMTGKSADKYESIAETNDPLFLDADYIKPYLPDAVNEDGSWNKETLKENGFVLMEDGNIGQPQVFPNEIMFAKSPLLSSLFQKHKTDGSGISTKKAYFDVVSDMMAITGFDPALHKPKMQRFNENGNMFILKTATFDHAPDEYSRTHHKEYNELLDRMSDAVSVLSFNTSSKGSNTYRTRQEQLLSVDNPNARALFDATGNIVDVIVKKDGEYKSDKDLFQKEVEYMQDNWAQGIIDPRMIMVMPVTGKEGITYLESSHKASRKGGALGVNQNLQFNTNFELFTEGKGPEVYKAFERWEDNVTALNKGKIEGAYELRNLIEGNEVTESKDNVKTDPSLLVHFPNNAKSGIKEKWQTSAGTFRKEILDKGITSTHDAIKNGLRTGTSRNKTQNVKEGQTINVGNRNEPIIAIVTKVYDKPLKELLSSGEMTKEQWSEREGWDEQYIDKNPQVLNKYPIDFKVKDEANSLNEKQLEHSFIDSTKLKKAGEVVSDIISEVKSKIEKGDENDEFMLPGMTNNEALELLESTLDTEGKVIPQNLNNLLLAGNLFVNGMKYAKPGEKTMLQYQVRDYFTNALLTRGFGTNLYLMPDLDSKASMARMWEPMIESLIEKGETDKADAKAEEYLQLLEEHFDENGQFKPYSNGIIIGSDVMEMFNVKPGDKVFLKNTPADDLHSLNSVVILGISNKPGALIGNAEFLAKVCGKDYDKDSMQLLFQNDKYISKEDFELIWEHWKDSKMTEGRYKQNAEEFLENERKSVNGVYKPLGDNIEHQDPTMTPQSKNAYDRTQNMNTNVGAMIAVRNMIANGNRNLEWTKDGNGVSTKLTTEYNTKEEQNLYDIKLYLETNSINGKNKLADTSNAINNKMVDSFDLMPFDPKKAIWDQMIDTVNGKRYSQYSNKDKAKIRKSLENAYREFSGYGIAELRKKDNLADVSDVIQRTNIEGSSVASKVGRMMTDIQVPVSNRPEINKYKFNNKIGQEIQKATLEMEKQYADKLDPTAHSFLFNAYRGSKLNIGQHIQELFKYYTNNYHSSKASPEQRAKALNNDIFSYVSTNDFGAFTQGHKWKDIAAGTALHDFFSKNPHKHPNLVKNKVFRGGYEYQYDGFNGWITKGENRVKLDDIFAENGDLKVDWLDGQVLSSEWIRNLVQRKSIVSDNAKAELIGRTIGNVSKYLSDAINTKNPDTTKPGELFTLLAYNSTGNVNQVYRNDRTKEFYNKSMYDWMHGRPKNKKYDANKMKEVNEETSKEMRYDPLYLMQGAKSVGVNPIVNGKDALTFMKDIGNQEGIDKHGPITGLASGDVLNMPELRFKRGGLDIRTPKKFLDSVNDLVGKAETDKLIKDIGNVTEWSKDDYKNVFDKVLDPALKKLIKQKGTDLKWRNETIELVTRQYLNNFSPYNMDSVIENIKKNTGGDDYNSTYVAQLALLGRSLKKHFGNKEGNRLSFLRPFGDRSPISMLKDYTLPEGLANYSGDKIIAEQYQTINGKLSLLKDIETNLDVLESTHYKVSDLPDIALNISSNNMVLPKSLIEFVEPRNFIEKISQSGEANIKTFKEKRTGDEKEGTIVSFDKDIRNQNNKSVSEIFSSLRDDDILSGIINEIEITSGFNGMIKSQDTQARLGDYKRDTENSLKEISDEVLNRWADAEIEAHRGDIAKQIEDGLIDEADAQDLISKKDILARAEEYRTIIENAIRLKALAQETANTLLSLAATVENVVELRQADIDDIQAQEIYVATKRLKDKANLLNSSDFRDLLKEFRSLDYTDGKTIDMFNEIFYDNSQKHMNEYKQVYDTYKENWKDKKYILTKDNVPFVFNNLYAKDNIPLFPYLANRFLKHIDINEIETGQYKPETEKSYKAFTRRILKSIEPDIKAKELNEKANQMWSDLKGITEKRFNINTALYEMGHKMGFSDHQTPLAEAEPEHVFKTGYKLRKELTRQYENKLKQIQDYYEIDMIDFKEPNLYMSIEDREIDLEEVAAYARPHLVDNSDIFKYSITNFKDKIKRDQNAVISAVENAFKTAYIKKYPNEGKVAEAIVMSELGKVTNDNAIYNQHYDKETIKKAKIEPGTDSYVRYMTKSGRPITAYGRILGTRDIVTKKEKNFDGSERVETNKFLFLQGERENGGKLYVINTDNIHDAVTGEVYGGRFSQPVMYNKKVKEVYAKNTNGLLDDIAKSLGEKSKFNNRKASDRYVEMVDRNEEVRSNIREKRMDLALEGFQDAMIITDAQLEKSFPERLKNSQKLMKDLIIADTYMGLRYLGMVGAGLTVGAVGGAFVGPLTGMLGVGMAIRGSAKYSKRIGRIMISNLLGNLSWVSRNTNNKKFLIGNAKEIYEATRRNLGIGNKDNNSDQSDAIAKVERLELEEGIESNRAAEMIDEAIYKNDNLQSKGIYDILKERSDAKLYSKEMKKISEQVERYKRNSEDLNPPIQEFLDQTIQKYAKVLSKRYGKVLSKRESVLEFKNDIPFINGKAMTHYQARELTLMNIASHYLSWKGHFIDYEVASTARAQKNVKHVLNEYYNTYEKHINNHAPNKFMYKHNTNTMLAQKSIGNYKKSTPQRNIMNVVAETFSRFAHLQKLDQTVYAWDRYKMYDAIMGEFKKDKDYQQWKAYTKELGGIPLNDYKIQSPKKELAFNLGFTVMSQAMKLAGLLLSGVVGKELYQDIEEALDTNEEYFGSAIVANDIVKTGLSAAALLLKEDGKSPRSEFKDLWWNTSSTMGGFTGYGVSTVMQEALVHTEIFMYNHYNEMSYSDKQRVKKYMDKLQKEKQFETVNKVLPIPVVNELIKSTPKIQETMKKDK